MKGFGEGEERRGVERMSVGSGDRKSGWVAGSVMGKLWREARSRPLMTDCVSIPVINDGGNTQGSLQVTFFYQTCLLIFLSFFLFFF
jgi:hypothetical protein